MQFILNMCFKYLHFKYFTTLHLNSGGELYRLKIGGERSYFDHRPKHQHCSQPADLWALRSVTDDRARGETAPAIGPMSKGPQSFCDCVTSLVTWVACSSRDLVEVDCRCICPKLYIPSIICIYRVAQ